jgi:hypothetical protein
MRITPFVLAGALAATAFAAPAAHAAKKKPITKTWQLTAATPDPTNYANTAGVGSYNVCAQNVPGSFQIVEFKAPAAGKIKVTLSGFTGDWDLLIMDKDGNELGYGGSASVNTPDAPAAGDETATLKAKKTGFVFKLVGCNWAGTSTATLKMTFTYA